MTKRHDNRQAQALLLKNFYLFNSDYNTSWCFIAAAAYFLSDIKSEKSFYNTKHKPNNPLALSLFVFRIFTDNANTAFSLNDFAFFADRLY